ncbi:hypothetical protein B0H16DRAFT_1493935 [Mycena metata]|uniref:Uncharacterized protein n=1 Tax=Mycena metata TaxID=1033252 RepID=A0AAD7KDQ1_9AGAR|nr:hypothetical protein B0H16DRAFT_1493935 [Mycena metata]
MNVCSPANHARAGSLWSSCYLRPPQELTVAGQSDAAQTYKAALPGPQLSRAHHAFVSPPGIILLYHSLSCRFYPRCTCPLGFAGLRRICIRSRASSFDRIPASRICQPFGGSRIEARNYPTRHRLDPRTLNISRTTNLSNNSQITRYSAAPVGPYDELIYIPGRWAYNLTDSGLRITQIYVSTNASVFNGRTNWNIPKHLADFDFAISADGSTTVTVSPPGDSSNPHFKAKLSPTTAPIPIQINTALTGDYLTLIQPSFSASATNPVEVGTDTWKQLLLNVQTDSLAATIISGALPGGKIGNGIGYPDIQPLLPIGARLSGTLVFPVPSIVPNM